MEQMELIELVYSFIYSCYI